jgi:F-type H+-transporting ATPase subunit gamma
MSGSGESIARKISTAGDLESVVRAMKALAVSSIGQYERSVQSLNDYYRTVELGLSVCLRKRGPLPAHIGASGPDRGAIGAVVFGSDQGLVGRFNEVVVDFTTDTLGKLPGAKKRIWAIGDRVHALLAETGLTQAGAMSLPSSVGGITPLIDQILIDLEQTLEKGDINEIYLFHNEPKPGSAYEPVSKKLLPLDRSWQSRIAAMAWPTKSRPEVIEDITPALPALIRGYIFVSLFKACAESLAAENASRLAAMLRAEENIGDMLVDLNRKFHRMRQESIDEELFDVISGYEALSGKGGSLGLP